MNKDSSAPEVSGTDQNKTEKPQGLLDAMAYIEQSYANECGGCMIDQLFLTTKLRIDLASTGFISSLTPGFVMAILAPVAAGVFKKSIPMFGNQTPSLFDMGCAVLLALSFALGYATFLARAAVSFIGPYTRSMVMHLFLGIVIGTIGVAMLASVVYDILNNTVLTDENIVSAAAKMSSYKIKKQQILQLSDWSIQFKEILHSAPNFVLAGVIILIAIPAITMVFAHHRNRKLIDAGIVHVKKDHI